MGEIEKGVWYQAAEALIQKAGEQKLLEALTDWESRHNYAKDVLKAQAFHVDLAQ